MTDPILVMSDDAVDGVHVVVNFGMYAGREATPAEVERLGESLLAHAGDVEIVCEERYRFDRERGANVYQVRVELPAGAGSADEIAAAVEEWARDCLAERRLITP